MRILSVAFPFAPVRIDAVGGAEQIVATLDAEIVAAGHQSLVLACAGSRVRGHLVATEAIAGPIDDRQRQRAWTRHAELLDRLVDGQVDVVHLHGLDFSHYLPSARIPTLATLHLPLDWYGPEITRLPVHLVCVSRSQRERGGPAFCDVPVIDNGVPLAPRAPCARQNFVLCLGRVCREKGFHLAVHAARAARLPLIIAGQVFPYHDHQDYFERELCPLFDEQRRFIGPVGGALKRQLLASARCVLIPSLVPETSSLVAMEAIGAGTPVVARPVGALPDIVDHGRTGLFADDVAGLAQALREIPRLHTEQLNQAASRFEARRMAAAYLDLYRTLA